MLVSTILAAAAAFLVCLGVLLWAVDGDVESGGGALALGAVLGGLRVAWAEADAVRA